MKLDKEIVLKVELKSPICCRFTIAKKSKQHTYNKAAFKSSFTIIRSLLPSTLAHIYFIILKTNTF